MCGTGLKQKKILDTYTKYCTHTNLHMLFIDALLRSHIFNLLTHTFIAIQQHLYACYIAPTHIHAQYIKRVHN